MHDHHHDHQPSPLDIQQLAEFDASLIDLSDDEKQHRRVAYLRDAMAKMEMGRSLLKGFGCLLIPFFIIPIFWPFLAFFWFVRKKTAAAMETQVAGALDYWGINEADVRVLPVGETESRPKTGKPYIDVETADPEPTVKRYQREP